MSETKLAASVRTAFGKGAARKIRRDAKVPAVVYGHGMEPVHLTLPGHDTMMALKVKNALINVEVEDGTKHLVVVKGVQRDPIKRHIEHVDLLVVKRGEKISVEVPLHTEGQAGPGTLVTMEHNTVTVLAEATHIPEQLVVSVANLPEGTTISAKEIELPEGTELDCDPDMMVINVAAMSKAASGADDEEGAAEAGDGTEAAAAAE